LLRLSFESSKKKDHVLEDAERHFKEIGLVTREKGDCCIHMEGGGGYVRVDITENDKIEVTLETREWDYQVRQFVQLYGK